MNKRKATRELTRLRVKRFRETKSDVVLSTSSSYQQLEVQTHSHCKDIEKGGILLECEEFEQIDELNNGEELNNNEESNNEEE